MSDVRKILHEYSSLTNNEINYIIQINESLKHISRLSNSDVFIDVRYLNENNVAIVVSEWLNEKDSLYQESVVKKLAYRKNEPAVLKTLDTGVTCNNIKAISQEDKHIIQNVVPITYGNKTIAALIEERVETVQEVSNQKIKILNKELDIITNILCSIIGVDVNGGQGLISEGVLIYNDNQQVVYYNDKAQKIYRDLGFTDNLNTYVYDQLTLSKFEFMDKSESESLIKAGNYYLGERKHFTASEDARCIVIIEDLTNIKSKDDEIVTTKYAISEMHHRIKNNLQVIGSMLRIQSRLSNSEEIRNALNISIQRIIATSNVHEVLSKTLEDEADIISVVTNLIKTIDLYLANEGQDIEIELNAKPLILDNVKLTIISIILNELIMNSVKHGFVDGKSGKIVISITNNDGCVEIIVSDNGVGFDYDSVKRGLGSSIVDGYVKDSLKGTIKVIAKVNEGATCTIRFSI